MNGVDRVKAICKERKIPISRLERDLGYANGYIGQLRKGVFPSDRLLEIAEYLSVSHTYILTGEDQKNTPAELGKRADSGMQLSENELYLIHLFRKLDERNRSATFSFMNSLYETQPGEKANPAPKEA